MTMILFSEILKESDTSLEQRQLFILSSRVQRMIALARRKTRWDVEVAPINKGYVITKDQGSTFMTRLLTAEADVLRNLQILIDFGQDYEQAGATTQNAT